jgi:hypothetical protein
MSKTLSIEKIKRMMYSGLRWRLQLPNYFPHNPVPRMDDPRLSQFSRGVICAYKDLLQSIDEIERLDNQRHKWSSRSEKKSTQYGTYDASDYDYMQEIRDA